MFWISENKENKKQPKQHKAVQFLVQMIVMRV